MKTKVPIILSNIYGNSFKLFINNSKHDKILMFKTFYYKYNCLGIPENLNSLRLISFWITTKILKSIGGNSLFISKSIQSHWNWNFNDCIVKLCILIFNTYWHQACRDGKVEDPPSPEFLKGVQNFVFDQRKNKHMILRKEPNCKF